MYVPCSAQSLLIKAVIGGLRGECRRIEDKFTAYNMELRPVAIRLDTDALHGNMQPDLTRGGSFKVMRALFETNRH